MINCCEDVEGGMRTVLVLSGSGEIGRLSVGRWSDHYLLRGRSRYECSSLRDRRGGRVHRQKNMGLLEDKVGGKGGRNGVNWDWT